MADDPPSFWTSIRFCFECLLFFSDHVIYDVRVVAPKNWSYFTNGRVLVLANLAMEKAQPLAIENKASERVFRLGVVRLV